MSFSYTKLKMFPLRSIPSVFLAVYKFAADINKLFLKKIKSPEQNKHYNQHESCVNPLNYFIKVAYCCKRAPQLSSSGLCWRVLTSQIKSKVWPGTRWSEDHLKPSTGRHPAEHPQPQDMSPGAISSSTRDRGCLVHQDTKGIEMCRASRHRRKCSAAAGPGQITAAL